MFISFIGTDSKGNKLLSKSQKFTNFSGSNLKNTVQSLMQIDNEGMLLQDDKQIDPKVLEKIPNSKFSMNKETTSQNIQSKSQTS